MKKIFYSIVVVNEERSVVAMSTYPTQEKAIEALRKDYEDTLALLESEGWKGQDLRENYCYDTAYYIEYGESFYGGEVCASQLHEEE